MDIRCKRCKYCSFSEGNGSPNRYYCSHPQNPSSVNRTAGATLICKTQRHSEEFTIKRTPRWCPEDARGGGQNVKQGN